MKTTVLFIAMVLIGLTSANATKTKVAPHGEDFTNATRYRYAEPIMFMERGVEFLIFPDGSFDFNTNPRNSFESYNDSFSESYYYRDTNSRRSSVNTTKGAHGTASRTSNYASSYDNTLIQHDFDGKVRRIGNVFINYDRIGKVKRIGTVYMNYNRGGFLSQVGGLRLTYDHWGGIVHSAGVVNFHNSQYNCNLGQGHNSNYDNYNGSHDYDDDEDDDYYYYRQNDIVKKQKKIKK